MYQSQSDRNQPTTSHHAKQNKQQDTHIPRFRLSLQTQSSLFFGFLAVFPIGIFCRLLLSSRHAFYCCLFCFRTDRVVQKSQKSMVTWIDGIHRSVSNV